MKEDKTFLSIQDLIEQFYASKMYLSIFFFLFGSLTLIYIIFFPANNQGKIKIYSINSIEFEKYMELKDFEEEFPINPDYLRELFIDEVLDREELKEKIKELKLVKKQDIDTEDSYEFKIDQESFNLVLFDKETSIASIQDATSSSEFAFSNRDFYTLEYSSRNKSDIIKVFQHTLNEANINTKKFLQYKMEKYKSDQIIRYKNNMEDIDLKIKSAKALYKNKTDNRIAFLKEQAEIARSMKIDENNIFNPNLVNANEGTVVATIETEIPYYYRGYIAIDKEIELLNNRDNDIFFIDEIIGFEKEKLLLKNDNTTEQLFSAFSDSPINSSFFQAASFDAANIAFEKEGLSNLIKLLVFITIYLVVSIIFLIMLASLRKIREG